MVHVLFRAVRSRNPFARVALGVLGLIVIAVFVTVGVFALAAVVVCGGVLLLLNALRTPPRSHTSAGSEAGAGAPRSAPPGVIEGEFKVVSAIPITRESHSETH